MIDEPCGICGEIIINASMGGTDICPACDCGKCRYCGIGIMVFKDECDDGASRQAVLDHMKWHHKHNPKLVKDINDAHRKMADRFEEKILNKHR